ncbi:MAG: aldehyde dehydrogenase, partial [Zetaproteobacteria bacterium]|nr:aldehyde dehydrogenase [Pseudobdellovibrionaceae bacterium]
MTEHTLSVNGAVLKTQSVFPVIDPATGESFAACPRPTLEQIDEAINSAQNAFFSWSALSQIERQDLIRICGDRLDKKADEIAALLTKEQGKTLKEAKREVAGLGYYFRLTAGMEIPEEVIEDTDDRLIKVVHKPLGVVAAISAWNYPLLLAAWKIAPAVSVGNTIVIKPSPDTPLSTMAMVNVLAEVLPPGVVNVVTGHEEEGQYLVTHPKVRKVTFTGSVPVGKIINSHAASDLKRITLELGGNDAAIILKDCDPKAIAPGIFWSAFSNNGQTCVAIKRVYVHEDIHDELVSEVTKIAQQVKLGAGTDPAAKLGP